MLTTEPKLKNVDKVRSDGVVYTPKILAEYVAQKLTEVWYQDLIQGKQSPSQAIKSFESLKAIDPACGEGELLLALMKKLYELPGTDEIDFTDKLYGLDLDQDALYVAKNKLAAQSLFGSDIENKFMVSNTLTDTDLIDYKFGKFDLLIANPPWGASTSSYNNKLRDKGYKLAKGQFDTSDLFIERSLSMMNDGGLCAFIIPDSIFAQDKKILRSLLLNGSEIKFIARLGEKLFKNINRACTVVIFRKVSRPNKNNQVTCMRLTPFYRGMILSGSLTFLDAEAVLKHDVKQGRFSAHPDHMFDIGTREIDIKLMQKISKNRAQFGKFITSSRGVELSKKGLVYKCYFCSKWSPVPTSKLPKCNHCSREIKIDDCEKSTIISKTKVKGSQPLLVGDSIQRYSLVNKYWIDAAVDGINYKNISMYYEPKILIRKTGVGITATVDYSNAMTNQVVYMFRLREKYKQSIALETILAIMNSRIMYYYLVKVFGESEWRSYPYLTQTQVLNLPIPDLTTRKAQLISKEIYENLNRYLSKNQSVPNTIDAKIERKIAELFGLDEQDYTAIYKNLSESQDLIPVKALTNIKLGDIFS